MACTRCVVVSCLLVIAAVVGFFAYRYLSDHSTEPPEEWKSSHRLAENVVPQNYAVLLRPNFGAKSFTGKNTIALTLHEARTSIILHTKSLNISKTELFSNDSRKVEIENAFEYPDNEFWVIVPKQKLAPGQYRLGLEFEGNLTGKIVGFYRSKYTAPDGTKRLHSQVTLNCFELKYGIYITMLRDNDVLG